MATTNNAQTATEILKAIGGQENVTTVAHCMIEICMTRLRFVLKDEGLSSDTALEAIPAVIKVIHAGGQVQIVIGATVDKVYDEVCKLGKFETQTSLKQELADEPSKKEKLTPKGIGNAIMGTISESPEKFV